MTREKRHRCKTIILKRLYKKIKEEKTKNQKKIVRNKRFSFLCHLKIQNGKRRWKKNIQYETSPNGNHLVTKLTIFIFSFCSNAIHSMNVEYTGQHRHHYIYCMRSIIIEVLKLVIVI